MSVPNPIIPENPMGHDPKLVSALQVLRHKLESLPEPLRGPFIVEGLKPYAPAVQVTEGQTWFELREPGRVPERKGPLPAPMVASFLRELFEHRPNAYVTVITMGHDGPMLQDGPECLQMLDGRSIGTGRKHMASARAAHDAALPKSNPVSNEELARFIRRAKLKRFSFAETALRIAEALEATRKSDAAMGLLTRLIKWDTDFPVNSFNGYAGLKELDRIIADAKAIGAGDSEL